MHLSKVSIRTIAKHYANTELVCSATLDFQIHLDIIAMATFLISRARTRKQVPSDGFKIDKVEESSCETELDDIIKEAPEFFRVNDQIGSVGP